MLLPALGRILLGGGWLVKSSGNGTEKGSGSVTQSVTTLWLGSVKVRAGIISREVMVRGHTRSTRINQGRQVLPFFLTPGLAIRLARTGHPELEELAIRS